MSSIENIQGNENAGNLTKSSTDDYTSLSVSLAFIYQSSSFAGLFWFLYSYWFEYFLGFEVLNILVMPAFTAFWSDIFLYVDIMSRL